MSRSQILGVLTVVGIVSVLAAGLLQRRLEPLTIEKVADNLFLIAGGGGHTAVYLAADGVVLVDTKLPRYGQRILERVQSVTDKPITHIISTHTHGDHVGGNDFFPASVEIVAHENTAGYMAGMKNIAEPATRHGLPDRTFKDRLTLLSGNDAIDLYYFGPAHTGGDTFIVFRSLRVMHAGDVFLGHQTPPTVDTNSGGSASSYSTTLSRAAEGIRNVDTVIPGHGAVATWQEFLDYRKFVASLATSVHTTASLRVENRRSSTGPLRGQRSLQVVLNWFEALKAVGR